MHLQIPAFLAVLPLSLLHFYGSRLPVPSASEPGLGSEGWMLRNECNCANPSAFRALLFVRAVT